MGEYRRAHVISFNFDISEDNNTSQEAHDFGGFAGGVLYPPSNWVTSDITFLVAAERGDTFAALKDHDDATVTLTNVVASVPRELPPEIFGAKFVKLEAGTVQTTDDKEVKVSVKS